MRQEEKQPTIFRGRRRTSGVPQIYKGPPSMSGELGQLLTPKAKTVTVPIRPCLKTTPPENAKHSLEFDNNSPVDCGSLSGGVFRKFHA